MNEPNVFFTNEVVLTKLFVPIIQYKQRSTTSVLHLLANATRTYHLGDFWVFKNSTTVYALCLTPLQPERLIKVLKATQSNNLNEFERYGRNYAPKELDYATRVEGQKTIISRGHLSLLGMLTITEKYVLNQKVGQNSVKFTIIKRRGETIGSKRRR